MRGRLLLSVVVLGAASAVPADAAVPGVNGRIAFSSEGDIWSVRPGGGELRRLTSTTREEAQASFSPDGASIAFRARPADGEPLQIYVMPAAGGEARRVTSGPRNESQPSWSPDGRSIVYRVTSRGGADGDVWVMDADGANPRALIATPGSDERYPVLSPDGTRLAFTSDRAGQVDVYVTGADGSAPRRLTTDPGGDSSPSWSPDGRRIAFERGNGRDQESKDVWTMTATGGAQRRLTTTPGVDAGPSWSPDGREIAFTSGRAGSDAIYRMRADGRRPSPVTGRATHEQSPDWQAVRSPAATVPAVLGRLGDAVEDLLAALVGGLEPR